MAQLRKQFSDCTASANTKMSKKEIIIGLVLATLAFKSSKGLLEVVDAGKESMSDWKNFDASQKMIMFAVVFSEIASFFGLYVMLMKK